MVTQKEAGLRKKEDYLQCLCAIRFAAVFRLFKSESKVSPINAIISFQV
jgi:hypothetical protein